MSARAHSASTPRWPFWLLLLAWMCANSPQAAVYATLSWLAEARHFSHQHRLTLAVAELLGGSASSAPVVAVAPADAPVKAPPVPPEAVLKKLHLAIERRTDFLPTAPQSDAYPATVCQVPDRRRAPPPHGPPRATSVA